MKRNILIIILAAVIITLLFFKGCKQNLEPLEQLYGRELVEALKDTLRSTRDSKNRQTSYIRVLEGDKKSLLDTIGIRDETVKWLVRVRNTTPKATTIVVASTTTVVDTVSKTIITNVFDTVIKDSVVFLYPTYESVWDEEWSNGRIVANKDLIRRNIMFRNEYEIWQKLEKKKKGLFSKKVLKVYFKNNNPYTTTDNLRSWTVKRKKKYFSIGIGSSIGYGFTIPDMQPTPYFGTIELQLHFKILEF